MKRMRPLLLAMLLTVAALLVAAQAQAYTVDNLVGYQGCIIDVANPECCCLFTVPPNGSFKAWDSAPLAIWFNYDSKPGVCYLSKQYVTMKRDGSAKMYPDRVEVYDAQGNLLQTVGMRIQTCSERQKK